MKNPIDLRDINDTMVDADQVLVAFKSTSEGIPNIRMIFSNHIEFVVFYGNEEDRDVNFIRLCKK